MVLLQNLRGLKYASYAYYLYKIPDRHLLGRTVTDFPVSHLIPHAMFIYAAFFVAFVLNFIIKYTSE
jgi:hypothetical protein